MLKQLFLGAMIAAAAFWSVPGCTQSADEEPAETPASVDATYQSTSPTGQPRVESLAERPSELRPDAAATPTSTLGLMVGVLVLLGLVVAGIALTLSAWRDDVRRRKRGYRRRIRRPGSPADRTVDDS